jgi:hypothetical protein
MVEENIVGRCGDLFSWEVMGGYDKSGHCSELI